MLGSTGTSYLKSMAPKSQPLPRWMCPLEGAEDALSKKLSPTFIEVNAISSEPNDIAMAQDGDEEIAAIKAALENEGGV